MEYSQNSMSVVLACPGKRFTHLQASALYNQGWLSKYITASYYKEGTIFYNAAKYGFINSKYKDKLISNIDDEKITVLEKAEILFKLASKIKNLSRLRPLIWDYRNSYFSSKARIIINNLMPVDVLYGYTSSCGETGRFLIDVAKDTNTKVYLEQSSLPQRYEKNILKLELEKWPDYNLSDGNIMPDFLMEDESYEFEHANRIVVPCDFVKNILVQYGVKSEKIHILTKVVDTKLYLQKQEFTKSKKLKILYVGRVSLLKGVLYLLESVYKIGGSHVELHIAGDIEIKEKYLKKYTDLVIYHGHISKSELIKLYHFCDIYVHPSLCESSVDVVSEAMSCGLPVIVTNASGSYHVEGQSGLSVKDRDVDDLVDKISFFLENKHCIEMMGRNARAGSLLRDSSKYEANYIELIRRMSELKNHE